MQPVAAVFLGIRTPRQEHSGSTAQYSVVHIEGCMRSYDWRMPEEKYRTTIDHLADVIYTYFDEYKEQGVREKCRSENITCGGQPDCRYPEPLLLLPKRQVRCNGDAGLLSSRGIEKSKFYLMTCHRRENVHIPSSFRTIIDLISKAPYPVYFPASYRTQKVLTEMGLTVPANVRMVDPIGYEEMLCLMVNSRGLITDSGTVVEETCISKFPVCRCARVQNGLRCMTWDRA